MRLRLRRVVAVTLVVAAATASLDAAAGGRLLGLNIHQSADVGVAVTEGCKGQVVRIDLNWFQVETAQGVYDWTVIDAVVNAAAAKGFAIIGTTGYTPAWAATPGADDTMNNAVPVAGTYDAFVTAAVTRYSDRVLYWELWNEPNLGQFFQGTATQYVDLIANPGAAAVHAACAQCKVLAPALATVGTNYGDWMKTVLLGAGSNIDVVTGHDYAVFDDMGGGGTSPDFFSKLDKHRVIKFGGKILYEDPLSMRESMVKYGAADKPFWITETGYEAVYGDAAAMATQAHFASEVLHAMVTRPWWQATVFYEAFDVAGQPYHWGFALADPDASMGYLPKPVCGVLAAPPSWDAAAIPEAGDEGAPDAGPDGRSHAREGGEEAATDGPGSGPHGGGGCSCGAAPAVAPSRAGLLAVGALVIARRRRSRRAVRRGAYP